MNFRIESIEYENIRDIDDLTLDFTQPGSSDICPLSLVQMPTGVGKTTTMGLLRRVILGTELESHQVRSYEPEGHAARGRFSVGFASGDIRYKNHLTLRYDFGKFEYQHSRVQEQGGGLNDGHYIPKELAKLFSEEMVDLFVFNGELTDEFIETDEGTAEQALKTVTRLDRIENKQAAIERLREQRSQKTGASTQQGLAGYRTRLQNAKESLTAKKARLREAKSRCADLDEQIDEKERDREQLISEHTDSFDDYTRLSESIEASREEVTMLSNQLRGDLHVPSRIDGMFEDVFDDLLSQMDAVQLPRATSAEFFESLADQEVCVCGRPFDEHSRAHMLDSTDQYLSNEDVGVLNALKERLKDPQEAIDPQSRLERIQTARVKLKELQTEREQLDVGDEQVEQKKAKLSEEIRSLENDKQDEETKIEYLETTRRAKQERYDLDWETNIPLARARVKKYEQKIAEATDTVEFKLQSEKAENIIADFVERSITSQKERQIVNSNERLDSILSYNPVQIESIDDSIQISNKGGTSEGQSLAVAYAYLSSLFEGSAVDIPFVIDSPAVSLDHHVRSQVARIITELFNQIIAFVTTTEKEGFVEAMPNLDENKMKYYTVHKTDELGCVEKHTGKEFFMQFEAEEDNEQ